jgi:S-adenosylmethionine:tRNA ribosyltransferase-isomerase
LIALRDFVESRGGELNGETQIFIVPGFEFRLVSKLITNFHQPNSTLLLLISALVGDRWKEIYEFALQENYRFLSYGDGSLLEGKKKIVLKSL